MSYKKPSFSKSLAFPYRHGGWKGSYLERESVSSSLLPSSKSIAKRDKPIQTVALSEKLKRELQNLFETNFVAAENEYRSTFRDLVSPEQFFEEMAEFAQRWLKNSLGVALNFEQAAVIAAVNGHVQVIARAGSGKTTTLVKLTVPCFS